MRFRNVPAYFVAVSALATGLLACGTTGAYTWVDEVPATTFTQRDARTIIAPGDTLNVRVYSQEGLTTKSKVRTDGKFAMPLVGEVDVAGKATAEINQIFAAKLKDYVNNPQVTVSIDEVAPLQVTIVGEVLHPGVYALDARAGVLQAIAAAGGITDFASHTRIFVLRGADPRGGPNRIRFSYDALARGEGRGPQFALRGGDTLVLE